MRIVRGDLLELAAGGHFDVIVHGCNCHHAMGAGIAQQIRERFPAAFTADLATPRGAGKLGTISSAAVVCEAHTLTIVNAYTQDHWRGAGVKLRYEALRAAMGVVKREFTGQRIAYPRIGAGLAGGDWEQISRIIDEELQGEHHTLVERAAGHLRDPNSRCD